MSKAKVARTTGDIRRKLCEILDGVISGELKSEQARDAIKVIAQINENMHAETRRALLMMQAGHKPEQFGAVALYDDQEQ